MPEFPSFTPADPDTWPPLLRLRLIVEDRATGYPGILPMSRSAFVNAVACGYIPAGIKLGGKVIAWRREDILEIVRNGVVGRREQRRRARTTARGAHKREQAPAVVGTVAQP
jgi:predicted DNA-binding transcriptional regulator AlpA